MSEIETLPASKRPKTTVQVFDQAPRANVMEPQGWGSTHKRTMVVNDASSSQPQKKRPKVEYVCEGCGKIMDSSQRKAAHCKGCQPYQKWKYGDAYHRKRNNRTKRKPRRSDYDTTYNFSGRETAKRRRSAKLIPIYGYNDISWIGPPIESSNDEIGEDMHYPGVVYGNTRYYLGDSVYLTSDNDVPFFGEITAFTESDGRPLVQTVWYNRWRDLSDEAIAKHPDGGNPNPKEVFAGFENDTNPVETIISKCNVKPLIKIKDLSSWKTQKDHFFYRFYYLNGEFYGKDGVLSEEERNLIEGNNTENPYGGDAYKNIRHRSSKRESGAQPTGDTCSCMHDDNSAEKLQYFHSAGDNGATYTMYRCMPYRDSSQPFEMQIWSNVGFLMDFHSHLSQNEVIGMLAGRWNKETKKLDIIRAYPGQIASGTGDDMNVEFDVISQVATNEEILNAGMQVVGWYHSHTNFHPDPSYRDIEVHTNHQVMFNNDNQPFIGGINGTYDERLLTPESVCNWFCVRSSTKPGAQGIPMKLFFEEVKQDALTDHELKTIEELINRYKNDPSKTDFKEVWRYEKNQDAGEESSTKSSNSGGDSGSSKTSTSSSEENKEVSQSEAPTKSLQELFIQVRKAEKKIRRIKAKISEIEDQEQRDAERAELAKGTPVTFADKLRFSLSKKLPEAYGCDETALIVENILKRVELAWKNPGH
eukprot:CAMPEP_0168529738 /NCGR_PEP_ID=MMETSP0405-20121227/14131_1 /TAXON_ID=498012 /ORGANISM="Trichosphaerium sp, Strain Am-I-7 wt" /LENGTH=700 /DNA_ID=CAMNT_0008553607 /DNA_START=99 /DNA_END=2201 /DNA_ORIENTATION=+